MWKVTGTPLPIPLIIPSLSSIPIMKSGQIYTTIYLPQIIRICSMSMPLCSLHSKWRGRFYTLLLLMVFLLLSCSNMRGEKVLSAYGLYAVIPFDDTDRLDVKWADYLASHLEKRTPMRSEEHTSELQSRQYLVCRLLLEK